MADPQKFTPGYSYTSWQSSNVAKPLPANRVDQDFANVEASTESLVNAVKDIRRSDGKLKNGIVTVDSLSPGVSPGFALRGQWSSGVNYVTADSVVYGAGFYRATVSHTAASGNRPDLDPTTWTYLFAVDDLAGAMSAVTYDPTGIVADAFDRANHYGTVTPSDDTVTTAKLADGAITSAKIADGTIATGDIADGAITSAKIADGTIATGDLADGVLSADTTGRAKMADGFVTAAKLSSSVFADKPTAEAGVDETRPLNSLRGWQQGVARDARLLHVRDQRASGTLGGSGIAGTQVRQLNTVVANGIVGASLAANAITLPAGTYEVLGRIVAYNMGHSRMLLRVVGGATVATSANSYAANATEGVQHDGIITGRFTLADTTALEIAHVASRAQSPNGLGTATATLGLPEIYADVMIWKVD